jgi:LPXTG-motif cell wall-anchored protein
MKQLAPLAVVYVLVAALVLPGSLLAAEDAAPSAEPAQEQAAAQPEQAPVPAPEQPAAQPTPADQAAAAQPGGEQGEGAKSSEEPVARAAAPGTVTIKDFSFSPASITVNVGESVTWRNNGPSGHSAKANDGSFDTGVFGRGGSRSHTFRNPGTFAYICEPHPFMKGTVRVVGSGSGGGSGGGSASGSGAGDSGAGGGAAGASGSGSGSGSSGSGSGSTLPKSGADAEALALLGLLLLGLGVAMRRRSAEAAPAHPGRIGW